MLVLHVSDTHLGATPSGLLFRARDVYEAFLETIDIALRERVDIYIHAGDFFNTSNPPPESYVVAYRGLKKLKDRNIKVVAIAGQHDLPKRYALSPLTILKDVGVLDYVAIDNIAVHDVEVNGKKTQFVCIPFNQRQRIPSLSIQRDSKPILVAHLLLKELGIPSSEADISIDLIPAGFRYIALGDYHIKTVLRSRDGVPIVYPGATEIHKVNEYGKKFVALADLHTEEVKVDFIELTSIRPWIILKCDDIKQCLNDIARSSRSITSSNRKKPLAYVVIDRLKAETIAKYLEELISKNIIEHYYIVPREEEEKDSTTLNVETYAEKLEYIDVEKILKDLVGDNNLATYILNLIENPSNIAAEDLVKYIKSDIDHLKDIEHRIKSSLNTVPQTRSTEATHTNNTSTQNRGKNSLFKGKLL
jgi:DNA repair exonuclease SbcCD nuclease subunit